MSRVSIPTLTESIDTFRAEVDTAITAVKNALLEGEYDKAVSGMNTLTQRVAKTNVAMRAVLIQGGLIDTQ